MSDCLRLQILKALCSLLETITPANGFADDLTGAVFRGRIYYGENDPLPMLGLIEPPVADDPLPGTSDSTDNKAKWPIVIQGFVRDDVKNPTDPAYRLQAAVRRLIAKEKARKGEGSERRASNILGFGSKIVSVEIGNPIVRPSDDISTVAYFWLVVKFEIVEDLSSD